ncbi:PorP/SprF family type IX secretion system membrane protein [Pontibacter mangrovi]|uniref:Type IX secretion system membrane protein PorP/SprF n=1 Tax=Pontibacter mangrovi TaxID=2589816 RepID=A0A501W1V8_9BACT|nr:type IX secretion system membrane protein PorP/SprF [Pontibacter mangrovi]TPE42585.1 type IX secretion system membrane protein PorP/SprF [Pontibacter mangrovi]
MKNYILIFCFMLVGSVAVAQQKALYSQYMTNYFLLNPAVAGAEKDLNVKAGYRNQWTGFEGAPKTYYLSAEMALDRGPSRSRRLRAYHGGGGYVYSDQVGPITQTGLQLSYAYHVPINRSMYLSSGIFAGVQQYRFDENKIHLADGTNDEDPVTQQGSYNAFLPDLSVGSYLHSEEFFVGASLFQVLGNKINKNRNKDIDDPARLSRHLFVSGGYNVDVNRNITVTPSVLIKYVSPAPIQADFNVRGEYHFTNRRKNANDDMVWAGLSYRTQDAIVGLVGVQFKEQYRLSYTYDITVSPMRHYSAGSHEIVLGFRIP